MRYMACLVAAVLVATATDALAGNRAVTYPKVRTFSGGYYGPTQANYQYQRRYGRPWHGQGGLYATRGVGYVNGYPGGGFYGYRGFGWPGCGWGYRSYSGWGGFGYSSFASGSYLGFGCGPIGYGVSPLVSYPLGVTVVEPSLVLQSPGVYSPIWSSNPYVNQALLNNGEVWGQEVPDLMTPQFETLDVEPLGKTEVLPAPSTPQAQLKSLQLEQRGDLRLQELDYLQAYLRYQEAAAAAEDRVEPHYRMGIALAGMKRFDKAVRELKRATELDRSWVKSVSLQELLGDGNLIGKVQLKQRVADWALADAYDADRLYLLGTLLYLDGDPDRARILLDTAVALVGNEQHLTAFAAAPGHQAVPAHQSDPAQLPPPPASESPAEPQPDSTSARKYVFPGPTSPPAVVAPQGPVFPSRFD